MALTKKQRDQLSDDEFAIPATREFPIHDRSHIKMAWSVIAKAKDMPSAQRISAQGRIIEKANAMGMDTQGWQAAPDANEPEADKGNLNDVLDSDVPDKNATEIVDMGASDEDDEDDDSKVRQEMEIQQQLQENELRRSLRGMSLSALGLEFSEPVKDHPNQAPFKGVLTKLNEPSDMPLSGSNGKCVMLTTEIAEESLPSLIGMAVDFTEDFDGHDARQKIGIITEANIVGDEIQIAGFFYSADFPVEVKRIQAEKSRMGFSFEAQATVKSMNDDPLVIKTCVFTGAAVLYKDKAAYTTTSLSAKKMEIDEMTPELKAQMEAMQKEIAELSKKLEASEAAAKKIEAASVLPMVKPHADALRSCAAAMSAAGLGNHASQGHAVILHKMADTMEAEALMGKMPDCYNGFYASADRKVEVAANAAVTAELTKMVDKIASLETKLDDAKKAAFNAAAEPERKTLTPAIAHLLAKAGIDGASTAESGIKLADLDKKLSSTSMSIADRLRVKLELSEAGQLKS